MIALPWKIMFILYRQYKLQEDHYFPEHLRKSWTTYQIL
jgi:hypothetical protein